MYILRDLWRGNITPSEQGSQKGSDYDKAMRKLSALEDELLSLLPSGSKELLRSFEAAQYEVDSIAHEEAFVEGVRIGVRFLLDALGHEQKNFV